MVYLVVLEAIANENTAVTYLWSDGTADQENPTDVLAGVYSVTVTNEFGCERNHNLHVDWNLTL